MDTPSALPHRTMRQRRDCDYCGQSRWYDPILWRTQQWVQPDDDPEIKICRRCVSDVVPWRAVDDGDLIVDDFGADSFSEESSP
jgi:hypothetical protein